ncbi:hypothetical protein J9B83_02360 [Marinomonas sp. A79]|uniref:Uncharacterized protein n=1 Tax=Marinomonas vulgaris TaxID=2823372 RepID=A0ABS5H9X2_9GAMM|nr:hypothetical protein [Marinomonas vulgaris]MBR7887769.1 hypothetical protein [Marinomonas vulgaris]
MSTFRTGLILASLLLSACTMPILQDAKNNQELNNTAQPSVSNQIDNLPIDKTPDQTAKDLKQPQNKDADPVTSAAEPVTADTGDTLAIEQAQLEDNIQRATSNFVELKQRTGSAPDVPSIFTPQPDSATSLDDSLQELRTYISKTNTALAVLDARVEDRQNIGANGDIIRIFVSEAIVNHGQSSFEAQPIVGQWVRGESRVIRLKDNILFENPKSEDLQIAFSETYQLIVNGQVISIVNPDKEKNNAEFSVSTQQNGKITGSLDYRIIESK